MSQAELINILSKSVVGNQQDLELAKSYLEQAITTRFPELLFQLSDILHNTSLPDIARLQAALQLKNQLFSKDIDTQEIYVNRWSALPDDVKNVIKRNCIESLGTEKCRPSQAAQCVGAIACCDLPRGLSFEIIAKLVENVITPSNVNEIREASLEAIGYICQDVSPQFLASKSNEILTAIVYGMRRDQPDDNVRLAATNALLNSLEFAKENFSIDAERHYIMQVVCESTQCANTKVRVAALQILVKILSLYYVYMKSYMEPALFAITVDAMKAADDEVALQGIEFWSTLCEEELDILIENRETMAESTISERTSMNYAAGAFVHLVPNLLMRLKQQDENDDDDDWNPCKAAGVCLGLLAECVEDKIVPHVLSFITENIKSEDWRSREAAVMAFGSILNGPSVETLAPLTDDALPVLITLMSDQNVAVRDTTAWALGRVCESVPTCCCSEKHLQPLLQVLYNGLIAEPRVAYNVCWAISSLVESAYKTALASSDEPETYSLSPFFSTVVEKLVSTTDRPDSNQNNLRGAAYEALMAMIKYSPKDCYEYIRKLFVIVIERLQKVLMMEERIQSSSDQMQISELQSVLCATLQTILHKISPEDAPQISDTITASLIRILSSPLAQNSGVQEDAFNAFSTLCETMGEDFVKYTDVVQPFIISAIKNFTAQQVFLAALGLFSDICRAIGVKVLPYCEEVMFLLLQCLGNDKLSRDAKPQILSLFGDIALAIGPAFANYLDIVMNTLKQATAAQLNSDDADIVDYFNSLRECCLDAFTGIVQGFRSQPSDLAMLAPHAEFILNFIDAIINCNVYTDSIVTAAIGLVGDLFMSYGSSVLPYADKAGIQKLLLEGRRSSNIKTKNLAIWAAKEIKKAKTSA